MLISGNDKYYSPMNNKKSRKVFILIVKPLYLLTWKNIQHQKKSNQRQKNQTKLIFVLRQLRKSWPPYGSFSKKVILNR